MGAETPPRRRGRATCLELILLLLVPAAAPACDDLAQAVAGALSRDPHQAVVDAGKRYAERVTEDGARWISGSASAYASWLSDAPFDALGLREYEGGVNLPVRLPGEKRALRAEGDAAREAATLAVTARSLEIAGMVREARWDLADARAALEQTEHEVEHLAEIDGLTAARVARGDAAPMDRDLTALELETARSALAVARGEHAAALQRWETLTGCTEAPPAVVVEVPADADLASDPLAHPALAFAAARREEARARLRAEEERPGRPTTLSLLLRRERGGPGAPAIDAVGVSLSVPFGRSGTRLRARGEASRAFAEADAEVNRLARELVRDRAAAASRLRAARAADAAAQGRLEHAERALERAHRAYEGGEWSTLDLLRLEAMAAEARLAARRARVAVGRAVARTRQLAGVLPQ